MKRLAVIFSLYLGVSSVFAGSLPTNYTVQSHGYLWRADGSSSTQGSGSIASWPTVTSGTVSCALSQVTSGPDGWTPPGSGTLIKSVCSGGASGGSITITITVNATSINNIGNFGYYFYDPTGDSTTSYSGPNWRMSANAGFSQFFSFSGSNVATVHPRRRGWNLLTYKAGDETSNTGSMTYGTSVIRFAINLTAIANTTTTFYFSDFLKGFYTKPQIMVWAADNNVGGYSTMFAYMNATSRKIPGSYMPTTQSLPSPTGSQLTVANLLEMQTAGWTIVPHQVNGTALTSMTTDQMQTEIDTVLAAHRTYGFTYKSFYYPAGGAGNAASDVVMASRGILYGNNTNTGNVKLSRPLYGGVFNPYAGLWSYTADGKTLADVKELVEHAIKYGGHTGILWHDASGADTVVFQESINYLVRLRDANIIDIVNYETFFNRLTNPRKVRQ